MAIKIDLRPRATDSLVTHSRFRNEYFVTPALRRQKDKNLLGEDFPRGFVRKAKNLV